MRATVMHKAARRPDRERPRRRRSSSPPTRSSASPAPASAAATSGRTTAARTSTGQRMGHEAIGVVEAVGSDVQHASSAARSSSCRSPTPTAPACSATRGCTTACVHGGFFGNGGGLDGAQAEALRIPQADGTLYPLQRRRGRRADALAAHAVGRDGHRPPRGGRGRVAPRRHASPSSATAPWACAASSPPSGSAPSRSSSWAATRTGSRSRSEFGATDVVSERGEEADRARARADRRLRRPLGSRMRRHRARRWTRRWASPARAARSAASACRTTRRSPARSRCSTSNVIVGGGPAPVRAYIDELLPDVLEGRIEPGRVFDRTVGLDGVPDGYRAMNDREAIKVMVRP